MKVSELMSDSVVTARPGDGLRQTWLRMRERDIRHLPVVDDHGVLVGIVSDRDLRRPDTVDVGPDTVEAFRLDDTTSVGAVMTGNPDRVRPDTPLAEALGRFLDRRYGALPVVDEGGRPVAMLSAYDLLRAFQRTGQV